MKFQPVVGYGVAGEPHSSGCSEADLVDSIKAETMTRRQAKRIVRTFSRRSKWYQVAAAKLGL